LSEWQVFSRPKALMRHCFLVPIPVLCDRLGIETTAEITVIDFLQPNVYAQPSEQLDWCRHP